MSTNSQGFPTGDDTEKGPPTTDGGTLPLEGDGDGSTIPLPSGILTPLHLAAGVEPVPGYLLTRLLGRGGFGEVWEAMAPGGVRVALKFIRLDTSAAGPEQRGLEVIRNIRHPHLVDVQFAVRVADCLVIAMSLCEQNLMDRLRACQTEGRPGLPLEELLGYMDDVAQAIDFLNEPRHPAGDGTGALVGVQHRDVKPLNIFLVGGSAKLADYGLAKILEAKRNDHSGSYTPNYVAPEALADKIVSTKSDQYSLAVTYYQLRTGRLPFSGGSVIYAQVHLPPDLSGLPEEERAIVARALAKQPDDRWPSCGEFVRRLKEASPNDAGATTEPALATPDPVSTLPGTQSGSPGMEWPDSLVGDPPVEPSGKPSSRRLPPWLIGVAAAAGLAALLTVTLPVTERREIPGPHPARPEAGEVPGVQDEIKATTFPAKPPLVASTKGPKEESAPPRSSELHVADKKGAEAPGRPEDVPTTVAGDPARVEEIFRTRCLSCHGGGKTKGGVKILDRDLLVKKEEVVPGKPDESNLFLLVTADDDTVMPPKDQPRLAAGEVEAIRAWIAAGAPLFKRPPPVLPFDVDSVLRAILQDVRSLPAEDRPFVRYLSLAHLRAGGITAEELDLHRDALAKTINHLSWEPEVVHPRPIDPSETVFRIDLRTLGWNARPFQRMVDAKPTGPSLVNLFDLALLEYPYGVVYEDSETFDQLAREFLKPAGQVRPIPYVRADWFVSTATLPPLYEDFLRLPFDLRVLEERLGVDARADIDDGRALRAGMTVSGVSRNNRVVERHPAKYGAYWLSFDFRTSKAQENLFRNPIDLKPAGGEVIFHLPNGLQGYLLADAAGNRLEAAPTEIVTDTFAEDKVVRNGLSCIRCHDSGMKGFTDDVHAAIGRLPDSPGFDRRKVLRLYPGQAALDPLLKGDSERFAAALHKALGKPQGREPLIAVSQRYLDAPLSLPAAAAELGAAPGDLRVLLGSRPFAGLGLSPLASEGAVRRDTWEESYDRIVRDLGLGVPVVPLDALTNRNIIPDAAGFDVTLATNKKNNVFAPGDTMVLTVTNTSGKDLYIELIGISARGKKVVLAPSTTVVKADQSYRFPAQGEIRIRGNVGKELITVFASDVAFPPGVLLQGADVVDRVLHSFDAVGLDFDPARVLKKTIEIETR